MVNSPDEELKGLGEEGRINEEMLDTNGELEITETLGLEVETIGEVITDEGMTILLLLEDGPMEDGELKDGNGE